jgi:hypothetical protein
MADESPGGSHQTPLKEHLTDVWEVAKVALRESLVILTIAGTGVGLELLLRWLGKLPTDGKPGDEAFATFFLIVKIAAYIAFGLIMIISLATDVLKAVRRFHDEWQRRH